MRLIINEFSKLWHIHALRVSVALLLCFPIIWLFAPDAARMSAYEGNQAIISAYQVPTLALFDTMPIFLPLLVAIASASLIGLEINHNTLPTMLLRPITRSQWLFAKMLVAIICPFIILALLLLVSLLCGFQYGYGSFIGGTGLGEYGWIGIGQMSPLQALWELLRGYFLAGMTLIPISLMALALAIIFMNGSSGALATITIVIAMNLLKVFPVLERFLLNSYLVVYGAPPQGVVWFFTLLVYSAVPAVIAMIIFERRDF